MYEAGHQEDFRKEVVKRGVTKYLLSVKNNQAGISPLYRNTKEREAHWLSKGGRPTSSSWFKSKGYGTTLKVQATVDSRLAKVIKDTLEGTEAPSDLKTLVLEDGGTSLRQLLVKSDPYESHRCGRKWCTICRMEETSGEPLEGVRVSCFQSGIGYNLRCERPPCKVSTHSSAYYEGESSRTPAIRLGQHLDLYRRTTQKAISSSWMWEHTHSHHNGVRGPNEGILDYTPSVTGVHRMVLDRTLDEGVRVKDRMDMRDMLCLNTKNEYYKAEYVRLDIRRFLEM